MTRDEKSLRSHVKALLTERQAHVDTVAAVRKLRFEDLEKTPYEGSKTLWEVFEHMRIAQWDILEFSRDARHASPDFPDGYWPERSAPVDEAAWLRARSEFERDLEAMTALAVAPETDLFAEIPHGTGQTILREALLVADHNAYHTGQLVSMMKALGVW